jgi:hydrogenase/urease accessory protein HupE
MGNFQKIGRAVFAVCLLSLLGASRAQAHLVTTGLGPVFDGISHFSISVEDVVPALALALFAGLRGPLAGRRALFVLPVAWVAGGLLSAMISELPKYPAPVLAGILAGTFLVLGLLVASDWRLPTAVVIALAVALGLIHGFINGYEMREDGATGGTVVLQMLGIMVVLFVLVALMSAMVISLRVPWTRIAVRVAGSWIAAMGLLWLGWSLTGRG